jgi:hypothetical protein
MRKLIATVAAVGLLAAPAALASTSGHPRGHHHARQVARQQCRAERLTLGVQQFRAKYGVPHALANCVRGHVPGDRQAATPCRAERRSGAQAFRQKYGQHPLNQCIKTKTSG